MRSVNVRWLKCFINIRQGGRTAGELSGAPDAKALKRHTSGHRIRATADEVKKDAHASDSDMKEQLKVPQLTDGNRFGGSAGNF